MWLSTHLSMEINQFFFVPKTKTSKMVWMCVLRIIWFWHQQSRNFRSVGNCMEFVAPFGTGTGFRLSNNKSYRIHIMNRRIGSTKERGKEIIREKAQSERERESDERKVHQWTSSTQNVTDEGKEEKNFVFCSRFEVDEHTCAYIFVLLKSIVFLSNKQRSISNSLFGKCWSSFKHVPFIDEQKRTASLLLYSIRKIPNDNANDCWTAKSRISPFVKQIAIYKPIGIPIVYSNYFLFFFSFLFFFLFFSIWNFHQSIYKIIQTSSLRIQRWPSFQKENREIQTFPPECK